MYFAFIKSRYKMIEQLNHLWDNQELYTFFHGTEFIRYKELEICECLPDRNYERDLFIELTRCDWILEQYTEKKG